LGLRDAGWACKHTEKYTGGHGRFKGLSDGGVMRRMALIEWKACLFCRKHFLGSAKRKFCSKQCRKKFHFLVYRMKRMLRDPQFKERSLARLYAWKEKKKREKEAQKQGETKQQVVFVDIEWI